MKQRPKGILALCTALLLVLLGGCQGEGRAALPRTASSPSRRGAPQRWSAAPGPTAARRQGRRFPWPSLPGGGVETFWLPLEGVVVAALGGTCQVEGDTATVRWLDQTVVYTIGAPGAQRNGTDWLPEDLPAFQDPAQTLPPEAVVPQVREGVWYLPLALAQPLLYGGTLWTQPTQDPAAGLVILGRELKADLTLGGFSLASRPQWEDLPADLTRGMAETGRQPSATGEPYDGVCWTGTGWPVGWSNPNPAGRTGRRQASSAGWSLPPETRPPPGAWKVGDTLDRAKLLCGPPGGPGPWDLPAGRAVWFGLPSVPGPGPDHHLESAYTTTSGDGGASPPLKQGPAAARGPVLFPGVAKGYDPTPYKPALPAQAERVWAATVPKADPEPPCSATMARAIWGSS